MTDKRHPALEPMVTKGKGLKNRLVVAPMSRASAMNDGTPTLEMAEYYEEFAKGGFGMIITEGVYPDAHYGIGYANQPGITTGKHVAGWKETTVKIRKHWSISVLQIMHAGALSQYHEETLGPSVVKPKGRTLQVYEGPEKYPTPGRAMTRQDIKQVIASFQQAAKNAEKAGFDGVEVHGANGYLLDQFATTYTNLRTDEYGGSAENRIRLTSEVIMAIKEVVSKEFIVGVRISQSKVNDEEYRWSGIEEAKIFYKSLEQAGADYLHIASEGTAFKETADLGGVTTTRLAKQEINIPIIANGGMHDPKLSAELIENGETDLVSIARWAISNPDYPIKLASNEGMLKFNVQMILPRATIKVARQWFLENNVGNELG